jgi:hypothetical protein
MTRLSPSGTEPRDTIPAPPPWDAAAECDDEFPTTEPGLPPTFEEISYDDGWSDALDPVSMVQLIGSARPN